MSEQEMEGEEEGAGPKTFVLGPASCGPVMSRRRMLLAGFWSAVLVGSGGVVGALTDFAWPRRVGAFGGTFVVSADEVPEPGADPVWFRQGRFYLSHLAPDQEGSPGGILAVYQKCTHLGCTVPWRPDFIFDDPATGLEKKGWFRCPCHGSTFTQGSAIRVYGPAPRPLDLMAVEVKTNGDIVVDTGAITQGSGENPGRAVPYNRPEAVGRGAASQRP